MNACVLAPTVRSHFSLAVCEMLRRQGISISSILVPRLLDAERVKSYWRREGLELVSKVWSKFLRHDMNKAAPLEHWLHANLPADFTLTGWARQHDAAIVSVQDFGDAAAQALMRMPAVDLIIFSGGGLIRNGLLRASRLGVMNCHSGLLPEYRGMDPALWAEWNGDEPGLTVHVMDAGIDTGPIIASRKLPRAIGESWTDYTNRVELTAAEFLAESAARLLRGEVQPQPQAVSAGKQYFVMHPRLRAEVMRRVAVPRKDHGAQANAVWSRLREAGAK